VVQQFLRDRGGTGFWHETYFRGGQIESVYIDMPRIGLAKFARSRPLVAHCSRPAAAWHAGRKRTAARHRRTRAVPAVRPTSRIAGLAAAIRKPPHTPECNAHGTADLASARVRRMTMCSALEQML